MEISKVVIKIGKKEIVLSLQEAKELKGVLEDAFLEKVTEKEYVPYVPYYPYYVHNQRPRVWWTSSDTNYTWESTNWKGVEQDNILYLRNHN